MNSPCQRLLLTHSKQLIELFGSESPRYVPEVRIAEQGGTESVNWTIKGVAELKQGKHIVTSAVEHVVVLECCKYLEKHHGYQVTYVGVDEHGRVSVEDVKKAIKEDTILVTIMHANNETGTINNIKAIAAEARSRGVLMHTDASQSVGKVPINVQDLGVDFLTVAGHKCLPPIPSTLHRCTISSIVGTPYS